MRKKIFLGLMMCGIMLGLCACNNGTPTTDETNVLWGTEANGTLKISNNTTKDMVVFNGQTPLITNIIGGVRAGSSRYFNIEDDVEDFNVGGYMILRAMTLDEYKAKKSNLANAKMEFSAMATYGQGKKFSADINPAYSGDFYFKVSNHGKIGMELRKDSPDGEKIGYLPAWATNYTLYAGSTDMMTVFPVYVYYSKTTQQVTTITANSFFDSVTVGPRPITNPNVVTIEFPAQGVEWEDIVGQLSSPVAYITCTNQVTNQGAYLTQSGTVRLFAQNGEDGMNAGETFTYEIASSDAGQDKNLIVTLYGGTIKVPVKNANGEKIMIKNGYDYSVMITFNGDNVREASNYSAIITEGEKRDISDEIESL